jgi:4-amino-4-deoxy-L-arabinose transferase-like glycosyltransferase
LSASSYTGTAAVIGPARRDWIAVFSLLTVFALVWIGELAWTSLAPPVDNIEQLIWVRSLAWGYHKHPPLPTWMIWLPARLFGATAAVSYGMGALATCSALAGFWSILRKRRGEHFAGIALVATLCVTFYNGRLYYYNHNVVLLLAVVACAACVLRAFERTSLAWWAGAGASLGLGALAKYQIALIGIAVAGTWLGQRAWRQPVHVHGLGLALVVALALFAPHAAWLVAHDYGPVRYAINSSLGMDAPVAARIPTAAHWLADQFLNRAAPAWLFLGVVAWPVRRGRIPTTGAVPDLTGTILLWWGVYPFALMAALTLATGSHLQSHWGTPFLPFTVAAVMDRCCRAGWERVSWPRSAVVFASIQAVLMLVNVATSPRGFASDSHWRTFPARRIAQTVGPAARRELGGPIRIVIGEGSVAGAVALELAEGPLVLLRAAESPWVPSDLIERCGALEFLDADRGDPNAHGSHVTATPRWRVVRPIRANACPR